MGSQNCSQVVRCPGGKDLFLTVLDVVNGADIDGKRTDRGCGNVSTSTTTRGLKIEVLENEKDC